MPNLPHILLSNARHNTLLIQLFIVIKSFICIVSFWNRVVVVVSLWSFQLETQFSVSCFIYGIFITLSLGLHLTVFIVWIVEVDRVLPTIWVETVKFHCPMHAITHRWFHRLLLKNDHHCQSCTGCCHCFLLTLFFLRHLSNVILYLSRNIYWHLPSETTQAKCCYTDWWLSSKVLYMSSYCKNWIL